MKTIDLTIRGMNCEVCGKTIEALLTTEPGVKAATVSYGSGGARVLFDPVTIDLPHTLSKRWSMRATECPRAGSAAPYSPACWAHSRH